MEKAKPVRKVLKVKRVPIAIKKFAEAKFDYAPRPVTDMFQLLGSGKVAEIVAVDPEPSLWQRLNLWFTGK